jgi:hypothetical protein
MRVEAPFTGQHHLMPLKFEIYRDGARLNSYTPLAAMAMGPESVPIPGEITFKDGLLVLGRTDEHAVGVSLLWDAGPFGAYQLETTRVPPRDEPYILNVELARARLMKIIQKQEDWNLFDFPKADKFTARFREAQNLFADALGKLGGTGGGGEPCRSVAGDRAGTFGTACRVSQRAFDQPAAFVEFVRAAHLRVPGGFVSAELTVSGIDRGEFRLRGRAHVVEGASAGGGGV